MNFAIIGLGFIWPRHKQAIEEIGGNILVTCDSDPAKQADFTDWMELYHHPIFKKVDAVVICTPNYLHGVMSREALRRRKRVLCEKPLSIDGIDGLEGVQTVLQLRKHPALQGIRCKEAFVEAKMYRDTGYWESWKGNAVKSGGTLYNLGIHYIDLLVYLLGKPVEIVKREVFEKEIYGTVLFERGVGRFHIEVVDSREQQGRKIFVDGRAIGLSDKDNLSYEDLHTEVYKDFIRGKGVGAKEAGVALDLVKQIVHGV